MAKHSEDPFARVAPFYDQLMDGVPYELWVDYVLELVERAPARPTPHWRVLDLATGTGNVAFVLARRGLQVLGVDQSPAMIAEARRKAERAGADTEFQVQDASALRLPARHFDLAVSLYDSLNYILDPRGFKQAVANVYTCLRPGGVFVFDLNGVHAYEAELFTQENLGPDQPVQYCWRSRFDRATRIARVDMLFRIPAQDQRFHIVHRQRAYETEHVIAWLRETGFSPVHAYRAFSFCPPDALSDRIYYLAIRPARR